MIEPTKKEKNKRSELWKIVNFKYRISATNESTLEEIWKFKTSILWGALLFVVFAFMLIMATSAIIIATPIRYYLPGYLDVEVRDQALKTALELETVQKQVYYQEAYIANLRDVFMGRSDLDSVKMINLDTVHVFENDPLLQKTQAEKDYVNRYSEDEMFNLSILATDMDLPMSNTAFYKPVKGLVVEKFSPASRQYGLKVNVDKKETVLATLEGSVMYAGYSASDEYTLQIQHSNGFVSLYKHNSLLLKKAGDQVKTGEAIAVVTVGEEDNKNNTVKSNYVVFELWFKGKPVDPQNYIFY